MFAWHFKGFKRLEDPTNKSGKHLAAEASVMEGPRLLQDIYHGRRFQPGVDRFSVLNRQVLVVPVNNWGHGRLAFGDNVGEDVGVSQEVGSRCASPEAVQSDGA